MERCANDKQLKRRSWRKWKLSVFGAIIHVENVRAISPINGTNQLLPTFFSTFFRTDTEIPLGITPSQTGKAIYDAVSELNYRQCALEMGLFPRLFVAPYHFSFGACIFSYLIYEALQIIDHLLPKRTKTQILKVICWRTRNIRLGILIHPFVSRNLWRLLDSFEVLICLIACVELGLFRIRAQENRRFRAKLTRIGYGETES